MSLRQLLIFDGCFVSLCFEKSFIFLEAKMSDIFIILYTIFVFDVFLSIRKRE